MTEGPSCCPKQIIAPKEFFRAKAAFDELDNNMDGTVSAAEFVSKAGDKRLDERHRLLLHPQAQEAKKKGSQDETRLGPAVRHQFASALSTQPEGFSRASGVQRPPLRAIDPIITQGHPGEREMPRSLTVDARHFVIRSHKLQGLFSSYRLAAGAYCRR